MDTTLAGFLCERQLDKVIWKKHKPWNVCAFIVSNVYFYPRTCTTSKWRGKGQPETHVEKLLKHVDLEKPTVS